MPSSELKQSELKQIVEQPLNDPAVAGRIASNLRTDEGVEQKHLDHRTFEVQWQELGGFWRCTVTSPGAPGYLARIDLHENATVRVEAREPCSVTVSPEDDVLCLTRYR